MSDGRGAAAPTAPALEAHKHAHEAGDGEIAGAIARGDLRRALSLCARLHGASIGRLCMAMLGSQVDADDVTQEALLAAHEGLAEFRGEGSVRAWLMGIARHKCLQHLERSRRRGARLRLVTEADVAALVDDVVGARQRAEQARALLERVRPSERDALLLRYGADLSFREVAAACGIDEPAARKRVSRALSKLRSVIEKEDSDD